MVIRNYHWLNSASQVLISPAPHHWFKRDSINNFHCLILTFDLDLQSQASQGQGWPSCQRSRSKVKWFKQESAHRQTDGNTHTHGRSKSIISPATRSIKIGYFRCILLRASFTNKGQIYSQLNSAYFWELNRICVSPTKCILLPNSS